MSVEIASSKTDTQPEKSESAARAERRSFFALAFALGMMSSAAYDACIAELDALPALDEAKEARLLAAEEARRNAAGVRLMALLVAQVIDVDGHNRQVLERGAGDLHWYSLAYHRDEDGRQFPIELYAG